MTQRFATLAGTAALLAVLTLVGAAAPAAAKPAAPGPRIDIAAPAAPGPRIDIVKVSGLIDPINADLLTNSLAAARRQAALLVVLQLNSTGGTLSRSRLDALVRGIHESPVPVAVWVGGSGHPRAYGQAWTLVQAADFTGEGPGSRIGTRAGRSISGDDAVDGHLLDVQAPTLVGFLGAMNGKVLKQTRLDLRSTASTGGFRKDARFAFSQLSILPKLLHTAASPDVAFVMLLIALSLVVFEFFTAGVGVAAGTAVAFGALAAYGLGVLPTRPYAVVLLGLSFVALSIDLQAGSPRFWTAVGAVAYAVGALRLYHGHAASPWVIGGMGALLLLLMISGMPAMIRTRFSTPTIGRESMVGAMGVAVSGVAPEGTVQINGAPWRARTNRATPIPAGEPVRVVAIDGLLLEVEPEEGGAREAHH